MTAGAQEVSAGPAVEEVAVGAEEVCLEISEGFSNLYDPTESHQALPGLHTAAWQPSGRMFQEFPPVLAAVPCPFGLAQLLAACGSEGCSSCHPHVRARRQLAAWSSCTQLCAFAGEGFFWKVSSRDVEITNSLYEASQKRNKSLLLCWIYGAVRLLRCTLHS